MIGAAWERMIRIGRDGSRTDSGLFAPAVWEVSRGLERGDFVARELLSKEDQQVMVNPSTEDADPSPPPFEVRLFHAGIPSGYGKWIIGEGRKRFEQFIGTQLPGANIEGVEEFVRFAITLAADLYAVAGKLRYVAKPVHTATLFPESTRPTVYRTMR